MAKTLKKTKNQKPPIKNKHKKLKKKYNLSPKIEIKKVELKNKKNIEVKREISMPEEQYIKRADRQLIKDIFNVKDAKKYLLFLGFDCDKVNINGLDDDKFEDCYQKLCEIENIINDKNMEYIIKKNKIFHLSRDYYDLLPHVFNNTDIDLYLIDDIDKIKKEICLLELIRSYIVLQTGFKNIKHEINDELKKRNYEYIYDNDENNNIKNDMEIFEENIENAERFNYNKRFLNPILEKGRLKLYYEITSINSADSLFSVISDYLNCHKNIYPEMNLMSLFKLKKKYINNNVSGILLWYGCEISQIYSILQNHFKLPEKSAPKTAFSYGKGIYFSANAFGQIQKCSMKNDYALLLICNVDISKAKKVDNFDYNYPKGLETKVIDIKKRIRRRKLKNIKEGEFEQDKIKGYYHDYVVYDPSLIEISYIAKVEIPYFFEGNFVDYVD